MWCPSCGTEYVEGVTKCADCGADLVAELDPDGELAKPRRPYEPASIDLSGWDESGRSALGWLLTGREIGFEWRDAKLIVDRVNKGVAEELVDFLESAPGPDGEDVDEASWVQSALARRRARRLRDFAAFIIGAALLEAILVQSLFGDFPGERAGTYRVLQFIQAFIVPFSLAVLIMACSYALELYAARVDADADARADRSRFDEPTSDADAEA